MPVTQLDTLILYAGCKANICFIEAEVSQVLIFIFWYMSVASSLCVSYRLRQRLKIMSWSWYAGTYAVSFFCVLYRFRRRSCQAGTYAVSIFCVMYMWQALFPLVYESFYGHYLLNQLIIFFFQLHAHNEKYLCKKKTCGLIIHVCHYC